MYSLRNETRGVPPDTSSCLKGKKTGFSAQKTARLRTPSTTTRLLLGELTSLSFVNRVFCTQEGRKKVHTGVLIF